VNRGGGTWLHAPGQLAVYCIVPLEWHGYTVGDYLDRLEDGLAGALGELSIPARRSSASRGIWGRTGQLAGIGAAVKNWVTYYGAVINVAPPMRLARRVMSEIATSSPWSSLAVERQQSARMTAVREGVVRRLAATLTGGRYHLHTGHPLLPSVHRRRNVRAG
jgi:lipoate-protein ligase B